MSRTRRRWLQAAAILAVGALIAVSCGDADDDDAADDESVSRAAGTLGDVDLSLIVAEISDGFGNLGQAQQRAVQGVAEGGATCSKQAAPRARPRPSQIEVELVSVVDDCLQFSYDVANFGSFVEDLATLRRQADVLAASPLLLEYRLNQVESDWAFEAVDATGLVADDAPRGVGRTVAVIDSGIDANRSDLDAVTIKRAPDSGSGDYTENGHGTIAAQIIVAPMGESNRGLAPGTQLLDVPADLCSPADCGCDPCAAMTPAEAIRWATDNGADIISMSFGYQPAPKPAWWQLLLDDDEVSSTTETIAVAITYASLSGVAMAAAAGNCATGPNSLCETENQFEIPAGHGDVIGVAAISVDARGRSTRATYSTQQAYVELAAPGDLTVIGTDGRSRERRGTSYATPFVAAALAVLSGTDGPLAGHPDRLDLARQMLFETAIDLAPAGRDRESGYGQLQIDAALRVAAAYAAANPPPTPSPIGTASPDNDT